MPWLAVYTRPSLEARAAERIRRLPVRVFYPHVVETKRIARPGGRTFRIGETKRALFSRYLFVDMGYSAFRAVRESEGVCGIVSIAGEPVEVPSIIVEDLMAKADEDGLIGRKDLVKLSSRFSGKVGDQVTFRPESYLAHVVGEIASLSRLDKHEQVVVFVEMLGARREVPINVSFIDSIMPKDQQRQYEAL